MLVTGHLASKGGQRPILSAAQDDTQPILPIRQFFRNRSLNQIRVLQLECHEATVGNLIKSAKCGLLGRASIGLCFRRCRKLWSG